MRILFLPPGWTILLCFVLWPLIQYTLAYLCHGLPDRVYHKDFWLFRGYKIEADGALYNRVFRISRWKHLLPDGSIAPQKEKYRKKHLKDFSVEGLEKFLLESRRAELTHWLPIPFFWIFGLIAPFEVIWYMLAYALAVNVPCILVQRYNRPRVERLLVKKRRKSGLKPMEGALS